MDARTWPDDPWLLSRWPQLGLIRGREDAGSGVRLDTELGWVHLKRRPHARVLAEVTVLDELAQRGVPVTVPLLAADGRGWAMLDEDALLVYRELPGAPRDAVGSPGFVEDAELVGRACAELDAQLAECDLALALAAGLPVRPNQQGLSGLRPQIVHRDFHASNVLFEGDRVSGYLDFDHLELAPRIVDLCYCAASALARVFESGETEHWFAVWRRMVRGHHSRLPLTEPEVEVTASVMQAVEDDFEVWCRSIDWEEGAVLSADLARFCADNAGRIVAIAREETQP